MEVVIAAIIIASVLVGFWKLQQQQFKSQQPLTYGLLCLGILGFVLIATSGLFYAMLIYLIALTPVLPLAMRLFQYNYYEQPAYDELSKISKPIIMQKEEALLVLGLDEFATLSEIKASHKAMLLRVHPDQGGSDYLTQKVNQARDILISARKPKIKP